jgi:hypothetical protein
MAPMACTGMRQLSSTAEIEDARYVAHVLQLGILPPEHRVVPDLARVQLVRRRTE